MAVRNLVLYLFFIATLLYGENTWEQTKLVWNFGLVTSCSVGVPPAPSEYFASEPVFDESRYENMNSGDLVWVQPQFVSLFVDKVLPRIQVPIILVISDGDASFPTECVTESQLETLENNMYIIHMFAQNCIYQGSSKKISHIPIGIDFHTVAYKGNSGGWGITGTPQTQEELLLASFQHAPPTSQRKLRAFVDFQHSDSMHASFDRYLQFGEDRASIFAQVSRSGVVDYGDWMRRSDLWKVKSEYAFSISPHGNGYDCHRTWEDLALGCIVIVKSSPLDPLYHGLPVVIVNDWSEVTKENFQKWIQEFRDVSHDREVRYRLTNHYWLARILSARARCKE